MRYRVEFTAAALRALKKLNKSARRQILSRVEELGLDPRSHGAEKLQGNLQLYRVRTGNFRIVYRIEDAVLVVVVVMVGDRKEIYRWLS